MGLISPMLELDVTSPMSVLWKSKLKCLLTSMLSFNSFLFMVLSQFLLLLLHPELELQLHLEPQPQPHPHNVSATAHDSIVNLSDMMMVTFSSLIHWLMSPTSS